MSSKTPKNRASGSKDGDFRLSIASLDRLPGQIRRPAYDRVAVTPGIVHLGIGAFHRAHQAVVVDDLLAAGATDWGIVGASLRSPATRDALAPQDCLYTTAVRSGAGTDHRIIGSVLACEVASEKSGALIARMADPATRIVSLTVTEKGYCHTPQTGDLDERHPDIVHDLQNPDTPRSAIGFLVAALAQPKDGGCCPLHRAVVRQSFRQRPHRGADRDAVRQPSIARSRQMDRSRSGLPFDHGGPDRAGDHRHRPIGDFVRARHDRRVAGGDRAIHAMDRGRSLSDGTAGFRGRGRADGLGRDAVRAHETAAAQRQPFGAGLSRLSRRPRDHRFHHDRHPLCGARATDDGRTRRRR